jgi:hypothetical protein
VGAKQKQVVFIVTCSRNEIAALNRLGCAKYLCKPCLYMRMPWFMLCVLAKQLGSLLLLLLLLLLQVRDTPMPPEYRHLQVSSSLLLQSQKSNCSSRFFCKSSDNSSALIYHCGCMPALL